MDHGVAWQRTWVNAEETQSLCVDDRGLAYGDGLFETMRCQAGMIPLLERHLARLADSASRLRIAIDIDKLRDEIGRFCSHPADGAQGSVVKLIVTRGRGGRGYAAPAEGESTRILLQRALPAYPQSWWDEGVAVRYCDMRLGTNVSLAGIKHLNRLEQVMARLEWNDPDIAEGLMADQKGRIVEGVSTNLFLVTGGRLITPSIEECGVAGVMRGLILEEAPRLLSIPSVTGRCERALLAAAQELFLCNAVVGVWPVRRLGSRNWSAGPITRKVQAHVAALFCS
jgi:4-amino-4-deoxychorismate lyase